MERIRYGARTPDELHNPELDKTSVESWATSLAAVYETDPAVIAAVLPPPLSPGDEPLVRINIARVDIGRGHPPFGAGTFAVACRHGELAGWYPLLMPMSTEQTVIGGRETFGEPKKLARVSLEVDGDEVRGEVERMGTTIIEITGVIGDDVPFAPETHRTDFYLKFLLDPSGEGFDDEPKLVHCHRRERTRWVKRVEGQVALKDSPFDPVADLPVLAVRTIELAERTSVQRGEIVGTVAADLVRPYVHQRYDDLSAARGR